ncbi:PqqD family protein of HPr-rel-A system [Paucibacter oligotrophus]|uniref:PqqD family protein of HPr-rel-A system n=1 Tax=Roseateles oligotrophus TaxID=1769250 RepID=A0A840L906_9BURK|nr:HPr-rel-A system PqqD family peptide chaperone [Roseateles oligotrophus]MBB4843243.1 PqqD family protein of HPr-rel-A system [Roseateles oligotrophus]
MPLQWRLQAGSPLCLRQLDDQYLVFNAASGDTHLLSASGHELLQFLSEQDAQAWSAQALAQALLGEAEDADLCLSLERSLRHFEQLGLIAPVLP